MLTMTTDINNFLQAVKNRVDTKLDMGSIDRNRQELANALEILFKRKFHGYLIEAVKNTYQYISRRKTVQDLYDIYYKKGFFELVHPEAQKYWATGIVKTGRFLKRVEQEIHNFISVKQTKNKITLHLSIDALEDIMSEHPSEGTSVLGAMTTMSKGSGKNKIEFWALQKHMATPEYRKYITEIRERGFDYIKAFWKIVGENLSGVDMLEEFRDVIKKCTGLLFEVDYTYTPTHLPKGVISRVELSDPKKRQGSSRQRTISEDVYTLLTAVGADTKGLSLKGIGIS